MSEENQSSWLAIPLIAQEGDSHVLNPSDTSDVVWVIQQNGLNFQGMILPPESDNGSIIAEDSSSEAENPSIVFEERVVSAEETDSSDSEVTLNSPSENDHSSWESEENPVLNINSVIIIERESDIVQEPSMAIVPENPNAGVENPIIRLENPDYEPEESTDAESSRGSNKRSYGVMMSEDDDGQTCPVCLDAWTSAGAHRLSSLKCGHLFGKSCISRWISLEKKKHCPQCNKKANANDIRELYATKLTALDATEKNRLEKELDEVKEHKRKLELELLRSNMTLESCKQQLDILKSRLAVLEGDNKSERRGLTQKSESIAPSKVLKFHLEKTYEIQDGSCRVSAYSPLTNTLIVAHHIRNQIFRGYALKKITKIGTDYHGHSCLLLHGKAVRDLCFHPFVPNLILSVSFDKTVKVSDVENRTVVQAYKTNHPLWSCCWDNDDQDIFYVGAGNGFVYVYDRRVANDPITYLSPTDDYGAVVALRSVPANPPFKGAVICCRCGPFRGLNSIIVYEKMSATEYGSIHLRELVGPFFSLSYNSETNHLLASCRPSVENPKVKHIYCELNGTRINKIFSFYGGTRQTLLCRSCFVHLRNDTLVAAFQENSNTIELWSTLTGARFQSIPVNDNILDLVSIRVENRNFLGTVSDSVVRFFEGPT